MTAPAPVAVRMTGISKSFGGIRALDGVDFEVFAGEVHALLGGNGAGKSTILKVLNGVHVPEEGEIEVGGQKLAARTPEAARAAGIAMNFQEMSLIPTLTVAQNIFLTREARDARGMIDDADSVRRAQAIFDMLQVEVDPTALVGDLGAGQKQLTEIAKAISQDARVLILDEPSTALSVSDVERLFVFLRQLKAKGVAIIYVSHRMDEIARIADRATILRDGRHVITAPLADLPIDVMIEHIVGKKSKGLADVARGDVSRGEVLLELANVTGPHKPENVSFALHRGEVLGLAGLLGSGRSALARVIAGIEPAVAGELATEPEILILDEPTAGIDIGSKAEIIRLVRELAQSGKAVIVISSELSELLTACDRILVMADGRAHQMLDRADLDDPEDRDPEHALQAAERRLQVEIQKALTIKEASHG